MSVIVLQSRCSQRAIQPNFAVAIAENTFSTKTKYKMKNAEEDARNDMHNENIMSEPKEELVSIPRKEFKNTKLDVKKLFIKTMKEAINNRNRLDESFFCRPDCLAEMWLVLNKNYDNVLFDPFVNCIEDFLAELLVDHRCYFAWSLAKEPKVYSEESELDFLTRLKSLKKELKLSDEFVAQKISIQEIARKIQWAAQSQNRRLFTENEFVFEPSREEWIRLLMYRVLAVTPDDYYEQGFLE